MSDYTEDLIAKVAWYYYIESMESSLLADRAHFEHAFNGAELLERVSAAGRIQIQQRVGVLVARLVGQIGDVDAFRRQAAGDLADHADSGGPSPAGRDDHTSCASAGSIPPA